MGESPLGHPCVSPYLRIDTHESGTDTFAFLFGIILGELYYRTGSLLPSIILHFINNTLSLILMNVFEEKDTLTDILGNTTAVHVWGMTGIAIFCLTFLLFKKEVKPVQWAVEATEPVPAEETNPQN